MVQPDEIHPASFVSHSKEAALAKLAISLRCWYEAVILQLCLETLHFVWLLQKGSNCLETLLMQAIIWLSPLKIWANFYIQGRSELVGVASQRCYVWDWDWGFFKRSETMPAIKLMQDSWWGTVFDQRLVIHKEMWHRDNIFTLQASTFFVFKQKCDTVPWAFTVGLNYLVCNAASECNKDNKGQWKNLA